MKSHSLSKQKAVYNFHITGTDICFMKPTKQVLYLEFYNSCVLFCQAPAFLFRGSYQRCSRLPW